MLGLRHRRGSILWRLSARIVSPHTRRRREPVLPKGEDGNYNVVLPNPPKCIVIIIVGPNVIGTCVLFVEEGLGCDVLGGYRTDPANSVVKWIRHCSE